VHRLPQPRRPFCVIPAQSIASARERRIARASHGQNL
jgi:hypothetical protein